MNRVDKILKYEEFYVKEIKKHTLKYSIYSAVSVVILIGIGFTAYLEYYKNSISHLHLENQSIISNNKIIPSITVLNNENKHNLKESENKSQIEGPSTIQKIIAENKGNQSPNAPIVRLHYSGSISGMPPQNQPLVTPPNNNKINAGILVVKKSPTVSKTTPIKVNESAKNFPSVNSGSSPATAIANIHNADNNDQLVIKGTIEPSKKVNDKPLFIAPNEKSGNGIIVYGPKIKKTSDGWSYSQGYKNNVIIKSPSGKYYSVHSGSFVDGKEVLHVGKRYITLTGNVFIKRN